MRWATVRYGRTYHITNMCVASPDPLFGNIQSPCGKGSTRHFFHALQIERPQRKGCQQELDKHCEKVVVIVDFAGPVVLLIKVGPASIIVVAVAVIVVIVVVVVVIVVRHGCE